MTLRPDNLLDFLVWCQREKEAGRMLTPTLRLVGRLALQYMMIAEEEETKNES